MRHLIVSVLLASLTVPACAKSHKEDFNFNAPCATVWPILRDAVVNSGKPNVVFDDRGMAVCYGVGLFFPCKNEIILSAQRDQYTMKTDTGSSGPDVQDAEDFKSR